MMSFHWLDSLSEKRANPFFGRNWDVVQLELKKMNEVAVKIDSDAIVLKKK